MFCQACGAPLQTPQANAASARTTTATASATGTNQRNRIIGIAAVVVAAAIVVFLVSSLFGGRSYEKTVDEFFGMITSADMGNILDLMPDDMVDYAMDEMGYSRDDLTRELDSMGQQLKSSLDSIASFLGAEVELSHKVLNAQDVIGGSLTALQEEYEDYDVTVKEAKMVDVELTVQAGSFEQSSNMSIPVIKVGGSWYLDVLNMDSVF